MPEVDTPRVPDPDSPSDSRPSDTSAGVGAPVSEAGESAGPAADALLQQALRARVGGLKVSGSDDDAAPRADWRRRFTRTQLVLMAVICGIAAGMGIGLLLI